jgi:sterol desaturase/sphingolipid hydroxylase (fatty acid hydroxylase superfamily)
MFMAIQVMSSIKVLVKIGLQWINLPSIQSHHQYFKDYGLYFLFWDRMMGTIRSDYDERFEEVKMR